MKSAENNVLCKKKKNIGTYMFIMLYIYAHFSYDQFKGLKI